MSEGGIPLDGHHLLRENVASCLIQEAAQPAERWTSKVQRDLEHPYTDQEVFEKVDRLDADARVLLKHVNQRGATYVGGSLVKGRFGANSDLDLVVEGHDVTGLALTGEYFVNVLKSFDLKAVWETNQPLKAIYRQALEEKGYHLSGQVVSPPSMVPFHLVERETPQP